MAWEGGKASVVVGLAAVALLAGPIASPASPVGGKPRSARSPAGAQPAARKRVGHKRVHRKRGVRRLSRRACLRRRLRLAVAICPVVQDSAKIVRKRTLRVWVRSKRRRYIRLYAVQTSRGRTVALTSSRTVLVRARGRALVRLRLTAAGRRALAGCRTPLEVRALVLKGRRGRPVSAFRVRGVLVRHSRRCPHSGVGGFGPTEPLPLSAVLGVGGPGPEHGGAATASNPDQGTASCDSLDPAVCLLPWPNDLFSVQDSSTDTGRRVSLDITSTPRNRAGKPIDPGDINRNDGYSPGSPIVTKVPGMDTPEAFARTGAVPITDLARTYDDNQPVVLINTRTLERQLIWAELDSNAPDDASRVLIIHPAVNLDENTRYVVALRNVRGRSGGLLAPGAAFRSLRDGTPSGDSAIERRRAHFEGLFSTLAAAGIDRDSLYLTWDFTVGSERSLSERQLSIRDDAYRQLGDTNLADLTVQGKAPAFQVTKVTDFTPATNSKTARRVEGTYTVPCYLNLPGCPSGSRFLYPPGSTHGPPMAIPGNTTTARFTCNIPHVAMAGGGARPALYGHGLFGSRGEVNQDQAQSMGQEHNFVYCATEWVGMACTDLPPTDQQGFQDLVTNLVLNRQPPTSPECDVPTAISAETDLSNFPTLVDRMDQAFVNFMYLGRLLIHPDGFSKDPAFRNASGGVIDTRRLFYDGNSQGGIFGGSLIALEPDLDRGVVGVPGMNYAILLQRSSDFGTGQPPSPNPSDPGSFLPQYAYPLYQSYPNVIERQLILSLMQQMWDHSDPNGLAAHMTTSPLPNTPAHHVLMHVALGDHQVSNYAAEAEARTIGARARLPWADPGRYFERDPTYGIAAIPGYPYDGSAIVLWDTGPLRKCGSSDCGTPPAPTTNTPPNQGADPHEAPRNAVAARAMKSDFLSIGGLVTNTCGARPCYADRWAGP